MGLNSLKNLANGLAATGANFKIGGFTVNLPTLNIFNSNIESPSTGTFIASAGSIVQTLTQGAKGGYVYRDTFNESQSNVKSPQPCWRFYSWPWPSIIK